MSGGAVYFFSPKATLYGTDSARLSHLSVFVRATTMQALPAAFALACVWGFRA